jgi:hypothetical protein
LEGIYNEVMHMKVLEGTHSSEIQGMMDLIRQKMGEADSAVNDLGYDEFHTVMVDGYEFRPDEGFYNQVDSMF